ncbi:MAG TPA: hypothetical protein VIV11_33835 [Kofleriaceae bacterium]
MRNPAVVVALLACACAAQSGPAPEINDTPDAGQVARLDARQDPPPPPPPDAGVLVDAATPPGDACISQVKQLLVNPAFDASPQGAGWQQTLVDIESPLITGDDGVLEHTPALKAWLGGYEALVGTATDVLVQNVTIPANTTHLVLTGMYDVRTGEPASTTAYDTAKLVITEMDGTVIATVLSLSNLTPKTAWTMFGHAFTQNLSGKTVRVRLTSSNDILDPTSFFFDSLALTATSGCPTLQ